MPTKFIALPLAALLLLTACQPPLPEESAGPDSYSAGEMREKVPEQSGDATPPPSYTPDAQPAENDLATESANDPEMVRSSENLRGNAWVGTLAEHLWSSNTALAPPYGDRYIFDLSGNYIFAENQAAPEVVRRYTFGIWWVEGDDLKLSAQKILTYDGGRAQHTTLVDGDALRAMLENGTYRFEYRDRLQRQVSTFRLQQLPDSSIQMGEYQLFPMSLENGPKDDLAFFYDYFPIAASVEAQPLQCNSVRGVNFLDNDSLLFHLYLGEGDGLLFYNLSGEQTALPMQADWRYPLVYDDAIVVVGNTELVLLSRTDGSELERVALPSGAGEASSSLALSPDRTRLAYSVWRGWDDAALILQDLSTGKTVEKPLTQKFSIAFGESAPASSFNRVNDIHFLDNDRVVYGLMLLIHNGIEATGMGITPWEGDSTFFLTACVDPAYDPDVPLGFGDCDVFAAGENAILYERHEKGVPGYGVAAYQPDYIESDTVYQIDAANRRLNTTTASNRSFYAANPQGTRLAVLEIPIVRLNYSNENENKKNPHLLNVAKLFIKTFIQAKQVPVVQQFGFLKSHFDH